MQKEFLVLILIFGFFSCKPDLEEKIASAYEALPDEIDYNMHVKPILSDKCFICHGPDKNKVAAGLELHFEEGAYAELTDSEGKFAIVPGNLKKSEVFNRIVTSDPNDIMPPPESYLTLTDEEKAILIKWIENDAEYRDHWAFIAPTKQSVPKGEGTYIANNVIDYFVVDKLKEKKLEQADISDKTTLLRRVYLDLTGLPPTKEDVDIFLNDTSPNAFEKQVDKLLSSEHYGEKMAVDWLDISRYADTFGYFVDRYRDMSPWRDWVINSFNENLPYDKFVTWQLAGDLLETPTKDQILATGFNRLHPQNLEGGIIDEEYRSEYVSDRTNVVGQGIMGLTVACAKCHDHKYDPISQKNYYELYGFFNNINETGQIPWDWSMPVPTLLLPSKEEEKFIATHKKLIDNTNNELEAVKKTELTKATKWINDGGYKKELFQDKKHRLAYFNFDNGLLENKLNPRQKGVMKTQFGGLQKAELKPGHTGKGLTFDGDAWLDIEKVGIFQRSESFSIAIKIFVPKDLKEGVIFHKGQGTGLHSYRGYHVNIKKDNTLEFLLAHVWPDNAIVESSIETIPREEWVQLTLTYDGSSKAKGLNLYMNGNLLESKVETDNLYKDIIFHDFEDYIYAKPIEPGLQIGARWRGKGIAGAVVDDVIVFDKELTPLEVLKNGNPSALTALISKNPNELSEDNKNKLAQYYLSAKSKSTQKVLNELQGLRTKYADSVDYIKEVMVMKEVPNIRKTHILNRGQYDDPGDEVFASTPESLPEMDKSLPKNRLGLAKWLTNPKHPLTARVAVNRYWQLFFGMGIVESSEDFGNQGQLPTHPKLLDWLALEFIESGWDLKALNKLIVMSHTYQQSSFSSNELRETDPDNKWLARGPSIRLTGEMLRDNALLASGLLNDKVGGESVSPYQPDGLWKMTHLPYKRDSGEKLYRRSLYTIWKRTAPNPTIATFDSPTRDICVSRRQETNTPLQALVLLNDPTYLECAKVIGEKMTTFKSLEEGIEDAYTRLTGRIIDPKELILLVDLQKEELEKFNLNISKANGWLNSGDYRFKNQDLLPLIAANSIVASTIMNSDATITKR